MAKTELHIIWVGTSKGGNTMILASDQESSARERREVEIGTKKYKQIILAPIGADADPTTASHVFYILLEGDVAADFEKGDALKAETSNDVISKGAKGELYAAYL